MSRTRLSLVLTVAALLVAMGCQAALAQTTPPQPPPPDPTFRHDRDTDYYLRIRAALAALERELLRVGRFHIPWRDAERIEEARKPVDELAAKVNPSEMAQRMPDDPADATLLDSIEPRDQDEVDRLAADAEQYGHPTPHPQTDDQSVQDGRNSWALAMKWLTQRLAEMAAKRAPAGQGQAAEPERPPAPAEERVALRPQATLHLEDDPRESVWRAAEEAGYWKAVLDRTDLTDDQRTAATKRSGTAEAALATAKDKAGRKLGGDEIGNLERDGRTKGAEEGAAAEPAPEAPPAPPAEELAERGKGGDTAEEPAASLDQVIGDVQGDKEPPPGMPVTPTTLAPETNEDEPGATEAPGGQVDPAQLDARGEGAKRSAVDWFTSGGDDDLIGGGTGPGGKLPPLIDCLGKVRTSTIDPCGGTTGGDGGKLPPAGAGPDFPGLEQGGRGEEDGCKAVAIAAFSTCGVNTDPRPDIFTPGPIDLPGPAGCGPAGIMAICTGTGADLGGTRVNIKPGPELDRLFDQWGTPASPPAPPVQPGGASSLAA